MGMWFAARYILQICLGIPMTRAGQPSFARRSCRQERKESSEGFTLPPKAA
jgi:hypothetical protein